MGKYLVVGAGGFIGGHLIQRCFSKNDIRAVDLKAPWICGFKDMKVLRIFI